MAAAGRLAPHVAEQVGPELLGLPRALSDHLCRDPGGHLLGAEAELWPLLDAEGGDVDECDQLPLLQRLQLSCRQAREVVCSQAALDLVDDGVAGCGDRLRGFVERNPLVFHGGAKPDLRNFAQRLLDFGVCHGRPVLDQPEDLSLGAAPVAVALALGRDLPAGALRGGAHQALVRLEGLQHAHELIVVPISRGRQFHRTLDHAIRCDDGHEVICRWGGHP
mmetsp:Transcript_113618/g.321727  ORF Transcript_113618/g.321727 Transcript_113618/m.321727 type:complete len:221 (-) Transcript_113618:39-701(-)